MSVRSIIIIFGAVAALVPFYLNFAEAPQAWKGDLDKTSAELLRLRATTVADVLIHGIYYQWQEIQGLAQFVAAGDGLDILRTRIETVKSINPQYVWIGMADPGGVVTMATDNALLGQNVSERLWFTVGLDRPFVGDVHEASLLRPASKKEGEPLRLIDLAVPVKRPDGSVRGVMAAHVNWTVVRELYRENAASTGAGAKLHLMLVSRNGTVLIGNPDLDGRPINVNSILAARQGASQTNIETWPDGKAYRVSVVPMAGFKDMPSFGWSLVAHEPVGEALSTRNGDMRLLTTSGLFGIAIFLLGLALASFVGRPLRQLARATKTMADGEFGQPVPETGGYSEVNELSASLARIQSKLASRPKLVA